MTVELKVHLPDRPLTAGIKVIETEAIMTSGDHRRRFAVELNNPIWPFGFAVFRTAAANGDVETVLELYDLNRPDERRIAPNLQSVGQDTGRTARISTVLPGGREVYI